MLSLVMPQKRLGILEHFPLTIDLSPGGVILVLIKNSVRQHYLHPLIGIMATMNEETRTLNIVQVCLGLTQALPLHVVGDVVPRDILWLVPLFLDEELTVHSLLVKHRYALCHAEAIPSPPSPSGGEAPHVEQELDRFRVPFILRRRQKGYPTICQLRLILPIDRSNVPHDRIVAILVASRIEIILVPKRPWLLGADHEPWAEYVQPSVHRFIKTAEPHGRIVSLVVLIERLYHCLNLVKLVYK
jgi:hypothetical protein